MRNLSSYLLAILMALVSWNLYAKSSDPGVKLGIDVLEASNFKMLKGKRVGLLSHDAARNYWGRSSKDVLYNASKKNKLNLVALFAPEHGFQGAIKAENDVNDEVDKDTGLNIYSLYHQTAGTSLPLEVTDKIDVLVIDLQDIGARTYTYTLLAARAMESCFRNGIEVVVLDRPNPQGGLKVDGPSLDTQWFSGVGHLSRVPYVHGLTIGELCKLAYDRMGTFAQEPKFTVVPMQHWKRNMLWGDTGLPWYPTSPRIKDLSAAFGYSMTGLGALSEGVDHGFNTDQIFRLINFKDKSPEEIKSALDRRRIPGLEFNIVDVTDFNGKEQKAVYVTISDWGKLRPTELNFHLMQLACEWSGKNIFADYDYAQLSTFNKHVGSSDLWMALIKHGQYFDLRGFLKKWQEESQAFQKASQKYWMYPVS